MNLDFFGVTAIICLTYMQLILRFSLHYVPVCCILCEAYQCMYTKINQAASNHQYTL